MRVQPARPSNPLTATVIDSLGERSAAWIAAHRPAPPAPRMRMSVSMLSIANSPVIANGGSRLSGARARQDYSVCSTRRANRRRSGVTDPFAAPGDDGLPHDDQQQREQPSTMGMTRGISVNVVVRLP